MFAYRRSIAKDVLGTDDPTEVQAALSDWDKFNDVAEKAAAKGYKMLSGYDDSYRTFSNNVSAGWVDGTTVKVDPNIMNWVDQTKTYTDNGYNNKTSLWSDQWAADQGPAGKVFGFFYSTWGINFTLLGNSLATPESEGGKQEVGNGIFGDYAVCQGPQPYYWGGTWICAAAGTDNIPTIKDVMYSLTCDADIMTKITEDTQDYTTARALWIPSRLTRTSAPHSSAARTTLPSLQRLRLPLICPTPVRMTRAATRPSRAASRITLTARLTLRPRRRTLRIRSRSSILS